MMDTPKRKRSPDFNPHAPGGARPLDWNKKVMVEAYISIHTPQVGRDYLFQHGT